MVISPHICAKGNAFWKKTIMSEVLWRGMEPNRKATQTQSYHVSYTSQKRNSIQAFPWLSSSPSVSSLISCFSPVSEEGLLCQWCLFHQLTSLFFLLPQSLPLNRSFHSVYRYVACQGENNQPNNTFLTVLYWLSSLVFFLNKYFWSIRYVSSTILNS